MKDFTKYAVIKETDYVYNCDGVAIANEDESEYEEVGTFMTYEDAKTFLDKCEMSKTPTDYGMLEKRYYLIKKNPEDGSATVIETL